MPGGGPVPRASLSGRGSGLIKKTKAKAAFFQNQSVTDSVLISTHNHNYVTNSLDPDRVFVFDRL